MHIYKKPVALVTGGAKGLGRSISLYLAKKGYLVVINYLNSEKEANETLDQVKKFSSESISICADVTDEKQVSKMFETIDREFGRLDVLINNVGNFIYKPIPQTSVSEFNEVISNNLSSVFICSKYAIELMKKNKFGRIISFGSCGADRMLVRKFTTPYYISKTGVLLLTKALSSEVAPFGITVNAISPGILESSVIKHKSPSGRDAKFDDIINAVDFLLKAESDYVNGANIEVAGGLVFGRE